MIKLSGKGDNGDGERIHGGHWGKGEECKGVRVGVGIKE